MNALTMAVTVAVVMVFVSVMSELISFSRTYTGREQVRVNVIPKIMAAGGGGGDLPMAYLPMLQKLDGVKVVQRQKAFFGKDKTTGTTYFISGEEDSGIELNQDFFEVPPEAFEAWKKEPLGALISAATAKAMNLQLGQTVELPTPLKPLQIKVVGIARKSTVAHRVAVHFDYLQQFTGNSGTCTFRLFASPGVADGLAQQVEELTRNSPVPATTFTEAQFAALSVRRVAIVPALLGFLGVFLLLTTTLTLANNNAIAIRERRIETATLRVLGLRKTAALRLLLGESVLIGVAGGLVSIAVTWFLFRNGVHLTVGAERLLGEVSLTPFAMVCGLVLAIVVPLAGALPAAWASIRAPLVQALRAAA